MLYFVLVRVVIEEKLMSNLSVYTSGLFVMFRMVSFRCYFVDSNFDVPLELKRMWIFDDRCITNLLEVVFTDTREDSKTKKKVFCMTHFCTYVVTFFRFQFFTRFFLFAQPKNNVSCFYQRFNIILFCDFL